MNSYKIKSSILLGDYDLRISKRFVILILGNRSEMGTVNICGHEF